MLKTAQHMRLLSRLMIGLFALQFFAAGACLATPSMDMSSTMMKSLTPSSQSALTFDADCDKAAMADSNHTDHTMSACAHCDLPNELLSNAISSFSIDLPLVVLSVPLEETVSSSIHLSVSPATGPPLVSPQLHYTNQRILI
ncbi:MAG: hypothetical protein Q9M17_03835 [Mariprofundus sp.]|nr:hypothetical protein [Mariprofundus sp.]